jgi:hypothetical protein
MSARFGNSQNAGTKGTGASQMMSAVTKSDRPVKKAILASRNTSCSPRCEARLIIIYPTKRIAIDPNKVITGIKTTSHLGEK